MKGKTGVTPIVVDACYERLPDHPNPGAFAFVSDPHSTFAESGLILEVALTGLAIVARTSVVPYEAARDLRTVVETIAEEYGSGCSICRSDSGGDVH